MLNWLKSLFGRGEPKYTPPTPEEEAAATAFDESKQTALDAVLGKMEEHVVHAIIPFAMGGGLDLYPFRRHVPGTLYVTQELFTWHKDDRPKPSKSGYFELAIAFREEVDMGGAEMPPSASQASKLLNPIAMYASMARLNPSETMEIPGDDGQPNTCIVLDRLDLHGKELAAGGQPFFLLLVIHIHPSEMAFAREHTSPELFKRLKARGFYPYSDLDRPPVA